SRGARTVPRRRRRPISALRRPGGRTRAAANGVRGSSCTCRAPGERLGLEDLGAEADAEVGELLGELGPRARRLEVAEEAAVLVDAHAVVEQEDVLEGDDVALHALHLGDVGDAAGAVTEPGEVDDEVEGRGHLLAD